MESETDPDEEVNATKVKILQYVTVGSFLEANAGKELANFTNSDFPPCTAFTSWCKQRSIKSHKEIPYNDIVTHIRESL
jgi:hypothetical protein